MTCTKSYFVATAKLYNSAQVIEEHCKENLKFRADYREVKKVFMESVVADPRGSNRVPVELVD